MHKGIERETVILTPPLFYVPETTGQVSLDMFAPAADPQMEQNPDQNARTLDYEPVKEMNGPNA